MIISIIAAMSKNNVIGKDNGLPWYLPEDLKFFKEKTTGKVVIMGRKSFDSLPPKYKPLPFRQNVVVTRNNDFNYDGVAVVNSIEDALSISRFLKEKEVFIIGGGEIYRSGMKYANRIYLTEIDKIIDGDTYFPEIDKDLWVEVSNKPNISNSFSFNFVTYERK